MADLTMKIKIATKTMAPITIPAIAPDERVLTFEAAEAPCAEVVGEIVLGANVSSGDGATLGLDVGWFVGLLG